MFNRLPPYWGSRMLVASGNSTRAALVLSLAYLIVSYNTPVFRAKDSLTGGLTIWYTFQISTTAEVGGLRVYAAVSSLVFSLCHQYHMNHRAVLALQERCGSLHIPPTHANAHAMPCYAHTTTQPVSSSSLINVAHYFFDRNALHGAYRQII